MAEPFKNLFSEQLMLYIAEALTEIGVECPAYEFIHHIKGDDWAELEFKQRMHRLADGVRTYLDDDFKVCVEQMYAIIDYSKQATTDKIKYAELAYIFMPDILERYGLNDFDVCVEAFVRITPFSSCEFAVRPFIIKYQDRMMARMYEWALHPNEHIRRLASEGSRPRLPWAMALPAFKKDPTPTLPILERLKNDDSEYVRKSVANHLNDISKDHPDVLIAIAKEWLGHCKATDWIMKHACRTLLKAGNAEVLSFFGFCPPENIEISNLHLTRELIKTGEELEFHFDIHNLSSQQELIRLEYAIYYMKQNGSLSKKVYKISEKYYEANSSTSITRRQSFKLISTRKFHPGQHLVSIVVNGVEFEERSFELIT